MKQYFESETVNCPVCERPPGLVWMDDGKVTKYIKCIQCGTVYASPRASFKERFSWLDKTYSPGESALKNAESRYQALWKEADILKKLINGGRLLDVGCDLGDFFHWFPSPDWERYGAEISTSAAKFAGKQYDAEVFPGTVRQAKFPDTYFDGVTMFDMLYLVDDPRSDILEAHRILKEGGVLAIDIAGQSYMLHRSRGILCWLVEKRWTRLSTDSSYLNWMSPSGLQQLLEKCGFKVSNYYIIRSPVSSDKLRNVLTYAHYHISTALLKVSAGSLTWAPKYLVIAKKI